MKLVVTILVAFLATACGKDNSSASFQAADKSSATQDPVTDGVPPLGYEDMHVSCLKVSIKIFRPEAYRFGDLDITLTAGGSAAPLTLRGPADYNQTQLEFQADDVEPGDYILKVWSEGLRRVYGQVKVSGQSCEKPVNHSVTMQPFNAGDKTDSIASLIGHGK